MWRIILCLVLGVGFVSCEDYLERAPETVLDMNDAFADFMNFQGFVENIYSNIPNKLKSGNYNVSWNWGDDATFNTDAKPVGNLTLNIDRGDFRAWTRTSGGYGHYLHRAGDSGNPGIWTSAWSCIRKANLGLANLDRMVGTDEERDLLAGQLYFFRAWWHFEMMMFLGGLPYIDEVQDQAAQLRVPRLSYQDCADKVAADFRRAADLLPINWDDTTVGKNTIGNNKLRINKIMALAYLGKNYLWAASPLMENGPQLGGIRTGMTYRYDEGYARLAAEAFGEVLTLIEDGQTPYKLVSFEYTDVYNHIKVPGTDSYSDIFYTKNQNMLMPGSTESIFQGPAPDGWLAWNFYQTLGPCGSGWNQHDTISHQPTANAVDQYGMENGLPIDDPDSGFDPTHPFKGRDPRFYHDIIFDGFKYINGTIDNERKYASLYTASVNASDPARGLMRDEVMTSRTGYYQQKIAPHTINFTDGDGTAWQRVHSYVSYIRLSDVYLMYAEACAVFGGASGKATNFSKTAEDAINVVRDRVGAGHVAAKYTADRDLFIDEIRRERAVELFWEGFRFWDLQRWLLLTEAPYNQLMAQDFTRVETLDWFVAGNDPREARVANWETGKQRVFLTRPFEPKHYWFPFPDSEVYLYPEFVQNPGW